MLNIRIKSLEDTERLAKILSNLIYKKCLITLNGDLAAGKTTFTKYLARYLGVVDTVNSPTFNILKEYNSNKGIFYHIDAYRLEGSEEDLGFEDIFYEDNIIVIEWAEFIEDFLPNDRLVFGIKLEGLERIVSIESKGETYYNILEEIEKEW